MSKFRLIIFLIAFTLTGANLTNAQSITDIFKKGSGSSIGDILSGVLSSSDLKVADLTGNWTSTGPAISFKGDNFLKKAGGVAAATAIEKKLQPYYTKYGLTGAKLVIDNTGNFELTIKKMKLKGTIEEATNTKEKGVFLFKFKAAGKVNLGTLTTYVQKTSKTMDVMFDATKLIALVNAVAKYSNLSTAKTLSSLLSSYDGLCVGFALRQ